MDALDSVRKYTDAKFITAGVVLSALAVAAGSLAGLLYGDLRGYLAFGVLVASVAMAASTALSLRASEPVYRFARVAWVTASVSVLVIAFLLGMKGGDTVLIYAMVALAFPLSLIAAPVVGALLGDATGQVFGLVLFWLLLFASGYVQWFLVLARVLRKDGRPSQNGEL